MGCDVYLSWDGITTEEKEKQYTGYDVTCGKFGYLRGAYGDHVGLKAIEMLFGTFYDDSDGKPTQIPIRVMETNLKKLENGLFKRRRKEFHPREQQSYRDFVALAKKKQIEGKMPKVAIR